MTKSKSIDLIQERWVATAQSSNVKHNQAGLPALAHFLVCTTLINMVSSRHSVSACSACLSGVLSRDPWERFRRRAPRSELPARSFAGRPASCIETDVAHQTFPTLAVHMYLHSHMQLLQLWLNALPK